MCYLLCILDRKQTQIKNTNKQIYVVPQNRVRPRRQQIVYYWRNDTNTQLNPVQSHKTQCFTLTLGVSLKSVFFTLTVALTCTHHTSSLLCTWHFFFFFLHSFLHSLYTRDGGYWQQQPMWRTNYYNDKSHGSSWWLMEKGWQLLQISTLARFFHPILVIDQCRLHCAIWRCTLKVLNTERCWPSPNNVGTWSLRHILWACQLDYLQYQSSVAEYPLHPQFLEQNENEHRYAWCGNDEPDSLQGK